MKITEFVLFSLNWSCRQLPFYNTMAVLAAARVAGRGTSGRLLLLERPLFKYGALTMGQVNFLVTR